MKLLKYILFFIASSCFAQSVDGTYKTVTATGTNNYVVPDALTSPDAYSPKEKWIVVFTNGNTAAITINRNGLGVKAVKKLDGSDFISGEVPNGGRLSITYNGTYYQALGVGSSGVSTFVGLTDGPGSFSGKTLNLIRVNAGETSLEYQTPSQVLSDIGGESVLTFSNGQTRTANSIKLGGAFTATTQMGSNGSGNFVYDNSGTIWNPGSTGLWYGTPGTYTANYSYVSVSDKTVDMGARTQSLAKSAFITITGAGDVQPTIKISGSTGFAGFQETADYSANYSTASLTRKSYVDGKLAGLTLTPSTGFLKYTGSAWSFDNSTYLTTNQTISFAPTGDVTGSTTGTTTLAPALTIGAGKVTNTMLAGSIAYSKLSLTGSILNADLAGGITDGNLATSYIKADGTRPLTGDWTAGAFKILIGASGSPASVLHTVNTSTSTPRGPLFDQYNSGTNSSRVYFRKARGTFASPSVITTGDAIGNLVFAAHDGTSFADAAQFLVTSTGTISTGIVQSTMALQTANASGTLTTALSVDGSQLLTLSAYTTNGGLFYANGSGAVSQTGAGTSTTVLHGGTTPSYSAVSLTADVSGILPVANGGSGSSSVTQYLLASGGTATGTNTFAFGSNPWIVTTGVTTGTGATAGLQFVANSLTTGNGFDASTSSLTTGNLFKLASTSTAANSNTQTILNVTTSGANSNSTQSTWGIDVSNTHTGTASTNIAMRLTASGGTNNYALITAGGYVGIGTSTPTGILHVVGSGSVPTVQTVGVGTGTNYSIRSFQSDASTEIFSLKDNGLFAFTPVVQGSTIASTWTATANNQFMGRFTGTATTENVASDVIIGYQFDPNFTRNAGNPATQTAYSVYIKQPTISNNITNTASLYIEGGTTSSTAPLRIGNSAFANSAFLYQPSNSNLIIDAASGNGGIGLNGGNIIGGTTLTFATSTGILGFPELRGKVNSGGTSLTLTGNINSPSSGTSVGVSIGGTSNAQTTATTKFFSFDASTINLNANATNVTIYGIDYNPTLTNTTGLGTHYGLLVRPIATLSGFGVTTPTARLELGGAMSSASWTTTGIQMAFDAATYTDTGTAGTRATGVAVGIAQPIYASTNAVTVTDASTFYIANNVAAGSNMTLTRSWSLWVDAGNSRFDGNLDFSQADATNFVFGTSTGTQIGTSTSQKIGHYGATPVVQPSAVTTPQGIATALTSLGLLATSTISNSVVASTFEKAETGTDANVLTYTTNASTDEYLLVNVSTDISALTGTSVVATVTWKDSNNATATSSVTLTGVTDGSVNVPINAFKNTNVVVSTSFTGASTAYNISAFITRLK